MKISRKVVLGCLGSLAITGAATAVAVNCPATQVTIGGKVYTVPAHTCEDGFTCGFNVLYDLNGTVIGVSATCFKINNPAA